MGLVKEVMKPGSGFFPRVGQIATVHATCFGKNGDPKKKFCSAGDPLSFKIGYGETVLGLDDGVLEMQVGEVARLWCPPAYAFGETGCATVPPNSHVIFKVELLSLEDEEEDDEYEYEYEYEDEDEYEEEEGGDVN